MNERIEFLAKQSSEYAIEFAVKDQELYLPKFVEKFAELMVQECVNTLEFHGFEEAIPYIKWMSTNKLGVE